MAIAIYVRVSTDAQAEQGTSLDTQVDACYKKAQDLGYDPSQAIIYRDEGESGADIDRPALNSLRAGVETKMVDEAIICFDPDRLSRKLNYQLVLEEEFKIAGVKLLFVNSDNKRETPEGMLLFHMQGAVAEYERTKIRERTIRGKLAKARQGQIMPMRTPPYGYILKDGKLSINENEVDIVKNVFKWYIGGLTMREIGIKLLNEGYEARYGKWNASTIRNVINNETYIGHYWYNRRKHEKLQTKTKGGNHAIKEKLRPKSDHILIEVPSIIDEVTWQKAQNQKTKNTKNAKRNTQLDYLARGGYLHCVDCGRVLQNTSYTNGHGDTAYRVGVYRCPNLNPRSYGTEKCPSSSIKAKILDEFIWNDLIQFCTFPENIEAVKEIESTDTTKEKEYLESQLEKLNKEREKVVYLYKKELIPQNQAEDDLTSIKRREQNIVNQLNLLIQQEVASKKTMTEEEKKNILTMAQPYMEKDATFEDKQFLFQTLVQSIDVKLRKAIVELSYKGVFDMNITHTYKPGVRDSN